MSKPGWRLATCLRTLESATETVAIERNLQIVPKQEFADCLLADGDSLEIVTLVGGGSGVGETTWDEPLQLGRYTFKSRLFVGTGKYSSFELMRDCLEASGTDCVTVAVRRVNLAAKGESLLDFIDRSKITILPNTAGCYSAEDALRTARLAREVLGTTLGETRSPRRRTNASSRSAGDAGSNDGSGQGRVRRPLLHVGRSRDGAKAGGRRRPVRDAGREPDRQRARRSQSEQPPHHP